ncbi:Protein of unknown function [Syntrophus gentianae]|uniref:Pvc16 N-terminal domain-containing protein n=1 Tax=Syntrophus gentianae TaxID=43775 RepID=A0A1H7V9D5_9BACT|nr:DUF4255 domain-containing protein [Syntrophus gentianae]SEM05786.1 Protein of unknown function [Syntrophus gentianae]
MSLPRSSLSQVCRAIADFVGVGLNASANSIQVMIGSPASAAPSVTDTTHRVNLFFYRIEPAGFFPGDTPGDPWWVRLHCLVTGFGIEEEQVSAGENDLRLLGEVMRLFHETPVQTALTVDDETFRLQVIFLPLGADDLNHIWSTQGDVSYRPSIAYEMALAPVLPREPRPESPLVGRIGSEVRAVSIARTSPFSGATAAPPVPRSTVDNSRPDWAPVICFVADEVCAGSLLFALGSQELTDFVPAVWVAGEPGAAVTLAWQRWTSSGGWQDEADTTNTTATSLTLDPELGGDAQTVEFALPVDLVSGGGQAVLYAERSWVRGADGVTVKVRSNPLLVTVYGGA